MIEDLIVTRNLSIKSDLITLKDVVENERFYSIPIYQRLYVWGEDQVTTLLEDLERATKTPDNYYFLGGTIIISNQSKYDLIDGQQRFTTLWLLSYELKNELEDFAYAHINKIYVKRISFTIRDFANQYFSNPDNYSQLTKEEKLQLEGITQAQKTIQTFLNAKERGNSIEFKKRLTMFLYEKVAFIETEMPSGIDENRLFEVLNNRGVQLQHHEIIKSKLIQYLPDYEKRKYAQIWEACSIMDNYIEKNIKDVCGFKWGDITQKETEEDNEIGLPADIINRIAKSTSDFEDKHLNEILELDKYSLKEDNEEYDYDSGKVRSIISFPMFLQHSLRIFIFNTKYEGFTSDKVAEVNEKKLIETFENHFYPYYLNQTDVKAFIELLLKLRINFDKHVIKWIEKEANQEIHLIKRLYQNKKVLQRKEPLSNEGLALLQSMLYHSQQITTLYWLTPFLNKTLQEDNTENLYKYLLKLDNLMFCSELSEDLSLRSWNLIDNKLNVFNPDIKALSRPSGTVFWSYWFYKTDFILWYLKASEQGDDWKNYRMTKKNSVEHISPQNRREYDENILWDENETLSDEEKKKRLDDFGNLVLLSIGMNSEYSNKSFAEKRTSFFEKKRLDSLKSALIFENRKWNWALCEQHRNEMITLFKEYFIKTMKSWTNE
ncbi:DUF262 domain-containing protein [Desulfosarcina ovata]|uniref:DUF262 domain-containing protein n=1 Tax=Desulfosarcina ovata subsp. ovata TaxID=2752305 RepID=A0A5K8A3W8_9BACT|nr:DUF262 domain-containing protein [Desulfosarcina ovata]BBO87137.1 hypothetical protein DSCOOX_03170 [Desulfosarcina ovata subsp. ovata]